MGVRTLTGERGGRSVAAVATPPRPPPRRPRSAAVAFRPSFTLVALYFFGFFVFFCLLLAMPALLEGLRALPAGDGPISDEERALAAEITKGALRGKLPYALLATVVALAAGIWTRALPGLPRRP